MTTAYVYTGRVLIRKIEYKIIPTYLYIIMWFLLLSVVSAQPFYKNTLRQLPNKLRQERIHAVVRQEVDRLEHKILEEAGHNKTEVNFTLFCMDPNLQYRENQLYNKYMGRIPENLIRTPL